MTSDIILNDDDIDIVGNVLLKRDENGSETLLLDVQNGNLVLGGNDTDGDVFLHDNEGNQRIHLNAQHGNLFLGGNDADGDVYLRDNEGNDRIHLDGQNGTIALGDEDAERNNSIELDGERGHLSLGGVGPEPPYLGRSGGTAEIRDGLDKERIYLNGGWDRPLDVLPENDVIKDLSDYLNSGRYVPILDDSDISLSPTVLR